MVKACASLLTLVLGCTGPAQPADQATRAASNPEAQPPPSFEAPTPAPAVASKPSARAVKTESPDSPAQDSQWSRISVCEDLPGDGTCLNERATASLKTAADKQQQDSAPRELTVIKQSGPPGDALAIAYTIGAPKRSPAQTGETDYRRCHLVLLDDGAEITTLVSQCGPNNLYGLRPVHTWISILPGRPRELLMHFEGENLHATREEAFAMMWADANGSWRVQPFYGVTCAAGTDARVSLVDDHLEWVCRPWTGTQAAGPPQRIGSLVWDGSAFVEAGPSGGTSATTSALGNRATHLPTRTQKSPLK